MKFKTLVLVAVAPVITFLNSGAIGLKVVDVPARFIFDLYKCLLAKIVIGNKGSQAQQYLLSASRNPKTKSSAELL
jgi:hypothetical protein